MKPAEICKQVLGPEKLGEIYHKLSSPQIKAVLKEGGIKPKLPGGFVSQSRRRKIWSSRIISAIDTDNDAVAGELLQQWLLNHQRGLLVAYLDALGVKHRDGETDESFLLSGSKDALRDEARKLLAAHDSVDVAAYLLYIAYQQRSNVYDDWEPLAALTAGPTSGDPAEAEATTDDPAPDR